MTEGTRTLSPLEHDDPCAAEQLLPLVYDELRRLAAHQLAREKAGQTLQPTALVHEAYARLLGTRASASRGELRWDSPGHFFGAAAEAMRRILIDRAREKRSAKRGGGRKRLDFDAVDVATRATPEQLLALDEALAKLAREDPAAARLVELRYFAGLGVGEAGKALGMSTATAYRHWKYARAWLHSELLGAAES
jgi:RNA polymerase sigma factor (TIGR02999 family)